MPSSSSTPAPGGGTDPVLAAVLSAIVPGAGWALTGRPRAFIVILVAEIVAFAAGWMLLLLPFHIVQFLVAGGLAAENSERAKGNVLPHSMLPSRDAPLG